MVGETGLEPAWISPQPPQDCAYTNSATRPYLVSQEWLRHSFGHNEMLIYPLHFVKQLKLKHSFNFNGAGGGT